MRRDKEHLMDIIEAARLAMDYVKDTSQEDFLKDVLRQDAVVRRLEIIGEAARRISDETREAHPGLPWHQMIAMRNVMIHEYDDIDLPLVWETVRASLPVLVKSLEKILSS